MEKVHVDKDGITAKPDLASSEIQQWASEAYDDCSTDDGIHEITYTEVRRTFHQCSNIPGPDGVTSQMIDSANRHDRVSVSTMERSLASVVPCRPWKLEHRILLPKPGKENYECNSYRTISITDILGKRFEKIISARL